jgi:hypothetical protein
MHHEKTSCNTVKKIFEDQGEANANTTKDAKQQYSLDKARLIKRQALKRQTSEANRHAAKVLNSE